MVDKKIAAGNAMIVVGIALSMYAYKKDNKTLVSISALITLGGIGYVLSQLYKKPNGKVYVITNALIAALGLLFLLVGLNKGEHTVVLMSALTLAVGGVTLNLAYYEDQIN